MELSKTHFCTKQTSKISSRWARSRFHILSLSRWLNNICTFDYLICFTQHGFFYSFCPILKKFSYEVVMFAIQHQYWDCFSYWCENFRKKCVASFFFIFDSWLFCFVSNWPALKLWFLYSQHIVFRKITILSGGLT